MSAWIPILTGLLAFVGAITGHFVAFDLNAAAKRREVRRVQIERFAEFMSEDDAWMKNYRQQMLYGEYHSETAISPSTKAYAIYLLYFGPELAMTMRAFMVARRDYEKALDNGFRNRLAAAIANGQPLSQIRLPTADQESISEIYSVYFKALLDNLGGASKIVQETIPKQSQIVRWCADGWGRLVDRLTRRP